MPIMHSGTDLYNCTNKYKMSGARSKRFKNDLVSDIVTADALLQLSELYPFNLTEDIFT